MNDRISTEVLANGAIRYAEYDSSGNLIGYKYFKPADEPSQEGTPINKATLLKDATALRVGLGADAVPDDVFNEIISRNYENVVITVIDKSGDWTAPKAVKQLFKVFLGGGGGGGGWGQTDYGNAGGGGGFVQIQELTIPQGTVIPIVCGAGGAQRVDGGASSFGSYMTANGGKAGGTIGGNGCGGGGCGSMGFNSFDAGNGDTYGGGGGALRVAGNGGTYGGGGGCASTSGSTPGTGGAYGGNGGLPDTDGQDGKGYSEPIITGLFQKIISPKSKGGKKSTYSGGYGGGGGGGYGGNGGAGGGNSGGGGGFLGNGGNAGSCGGGGGGFLGNGGDGSGQGGGGGGGLFGNGATSNTSNRGGGGGGLKDANGVQGGDGGCIIMYIKED